jgi:hypothetical protein
MGYDHRRSAAPYPQVENDPVDGEWEVKEAGKI